MKPLVIKKRMKDGSIKTYTYDRSRYVTKYDSPIEKVNKLRAKWQRQADRRNRTQGKLLVVGKTGNTYEDRIEKIRNTFLNNINPNNKDKVTTINNIINATVHSFQKGNTPLTENRLIANVNRHLTDDSLFEIVGLTDNNIVTNRRIITLINNMGYSPEELANKLDVTIDELLNPVNWDFNSGTSTDYMVFHVVGKGSWKFNKDFDYNDQGFEILNAAGDAV